MAPTPARSCRLPTMTDPKEDTVTLPALFDLLRALKPLQEKIIGTTVYWDEGTKERKGHITEFTTNGAVSTFIAETDDGWTYTLEPEEVRYEPRSNE